MHAHNMSKVNFASQEELMSIGNIPSIVFKIIFYSCFQLCIIQLWYAGWQHLESIQNLKVVHTVPEVTISLFLFSHNHMYTSSIMDLH